MESYSTVLSRGLKFSGIEEEGADGDGPSQNTVDFKFNRMGALQVGQSLSKLKRKPFKKEFIRQAFGSNQVMSQFQFQSAYNQPANYSQTMLDGYSMHSSMQQQHQQVNTMQPPYGFGVTTVMPTVMNSFDTVNNNQASKRPYNKTNFSPSSLYKTELCRSFEQFGTCRYGLTCQFAHGLEELREIERHPKYKTRFCYTFHSNGFCPYGNRCHFIHDVCEKISRERLLRLRKR